MPLTESVGMLINCETGAAVDPILADPATGRPVAEPYYALVPGRAANDRVLEKYHAIPEAQSVAAAPVRPSRSTAR